MPMLGLTIGEWAFAEDVSEWIEIVAIGVIAIGVIVAISRSIFFWLTTNGDRGYEVFKHDIARGLLIGLDLLIAADIIRTVTLDPTLENVAALGLLVLVRTFLSWSLQLEAEGRWPWQASTMESATDPAVESTAPAD